MVAQYNGVYVTWFVHFQPCFCVQVGRQVELRSRKQDSQTGQSNDMKMRRPGGWRKGVQSSDKNKKLPLNLPAGN